MVRITLTAPNAALAGVMLKTSFAIFMASMAAFKEERTVSRCFCSWDFGFIVEGRGSRKETTWRPDARKHSHLMRRAVPGSHDETSQDARWLTRNIIFEYAD